MIGTDELFGFASFASIFKGSFIPKTDALGIITSEPIYAEQIGSVSIDSALRISSVWACVRRISESAGSLPLMLYRDTGEGGRIVDRKNPLYNLLHSAPNADFTAAEYITRLVADMCLSGNHFSEISRSKAGSAVALTGLDPALVSVGRKPNGSVGYLYASPYRSGYREIREENMLHVRGFSTTSCDLLGLSPISCARTSLQIASGYDSISLNVNKNGLRPSGILTTDKILNDVQREGQRNRIKDAVGGPDNAGKLLVLEGGYSYSPMAMTLADAQFLESKDHSIADICRWFGVPPIMIGHNNGTPSWGAGIEQQNTSFYQSTLRPYLVAIEQSLARKVIPFSERGVLSAEFNLDGILRGDTKTRTESYVKLVSNGIFTRNEVRGMENKPPLPGGDVLTAQVNLAPLDQLGRQKKEPLKSNQGVQNDKN